MDGVNCKNSSISLASLPKSVFHIVKLPILARIISILPSTLKQWVKLKLETKEIRIPPVFPDNVKMAMWMDMYPDIKQFSALTGIEFSPPNIQTSPNNFAGLTHLEEPVYAQR